MYKSDNLSPGEILLTIGLVLIFGLVWTQWPEIKVSSRTLERYVRSDARAPSWRNGIGLTVTAKCLNDPLTNGAEFETYRALTEQYLVFLLRVDIQGAAYPTMVDLPYDRMRLTDASGRQFHLVNGMMAANTSDSTLRQVLEVFDWSIVNNPFSRQRRLEQGLLLFEPGRGDVEALRLQVNLYHHGVKQIDLMFPFAGSTQWKRPSSSEPEITAHALTPRLR